MEAEGQTAGGGSPGTGDPNRLHIWGGGGYTGRALYGDHRQRKYIKAVRSEVSHEGDPIGEGRKKG